MHLSDIRIICLIEYEAKELCSFTFRNPHPTDRNNPVKCIISPGLTIKINGLMWQLSNFNFTHYIQRSMHHSRRIGRDRSYCRNFITRTYTCESQGDLKSAGCRWRKVGNAFLFAPQPVPTRVGKDAAQPTDLPLTFGGKRYVISPPRRSRL